MIPEQKVDRKKKISTLILEYYSNVIDEVVKLRQRKLLINVFFYLIILFFGLAMISLGLRLGPVVYWTFIALEWAVFISMGVLVIKNK
jgi:hypothetical protein